MRHAFLFLTGALLFFWGCNTGNDFSDVPEISYLGLSPDTIIENRDSVVVSFRFTDGDGNLGKYRLDGEDTIYTVLYVTDTRADKLPPEQAQYFTQAFAIDTNLMPSIKKKTILGKMAIAVDNTPLLFPKVDPVSGNAYEKTSFRIWIYDRDNNKSNVIETDSVTIIQ